MPNLFEDDSNENLSIKTENEFAKNYNKWRKKEEMNKLKAKYGEVESGSDSSSSSEDDDDDEIEFSKEFEVEFLKTLSYLKTKDPCIYDEKTAFFQNVEEIGKQSKEKKEKPMYLKDYERKLIVENLGNLSDEDVQIKIEKTPTYTEEQEKIKNDLKNALQKVISEDQNEEDGFGGILVKREKTEEEKVREDEDYKLWLAGQKKHLSDSKIESQLKPLKEYWNNPNLDKNEKFLKDYILNNRYRDRGDDSYTPTYEEIVHDSDEGLSEDEKAVNKQEEFEQKYNFRFEEPDKDFIKRYPRLMECSLRKKDDRRSIKRAEIKERKKKEKMQKMEEIKQLKALKMKEIEEKIQMLKEITGNDNVAFTMEDFEGDFDPEEHDKKMQDFFSNSYYDDDDLNEEQKPQFPDIDKELDLEPENWDQWQGEKDDENCEEDEYQPHCEDEDFNMDCDYDPTKNHDDEETKSRKKRKRKSKFSKVISQPKPTFNPNDKTFSEYLDEYYKLDCEDIVGDLPCRFKYRQVIPNNFGLTTEEILLANDKELNRWCSLKKAIQYRPENIEKYDKIIYERKGKDENLKRKILPSLYSNDEENQNDQNKSKQKGLVDTKCSDKKLEETQDTSKSKKKKLKIDASFSEKKSEERKGTTSKSKTEKLKNDTSYYADNKLEDMQDTSKSKKRKLEVDTSSSEKKPEEMVNLKQKKKKKKNSKVKQSNLEVTKEVKKETEDRKIPKEKKSDQQGENKKNKNKQKVDKTNKKVMKNNKKNKKYQAHKLNKKFDKKPKSEDYDYLMAISDERLKAYGINPKKFRNKLKYKTEN